MRSLERLVSPELALCFVTTAASSVGFFLPFAVVPLFAAHAGGAVAAGMATTALLVATVAVELVAPRILTRIGTRAGLALGLFLLGAPILLLLVSSGPLLIVVVSVVRGVGFALIVVAGGALTAALLPTGRRGEALAVLGMVSGIPSMIALPAGVLMAQLWGYAPVFVVTAVLPVLSALTIPWLSARAPGVGAPVGVIHALRNVWPPTVVFAASAAGAGVLATYLPLAARGVPAWVVPCALFAQTLVATLVKPAVGRLGDRRRHDVLLLPGVVLAALGMAALFFTAEPVVIIAGAAVFGAGFGTLQNSTLTLMYEKVGADGYPAASAIWNAAYDSGMAVGAALVGAIVGLIGFPAAFVLTGATIALGGLAHLRRPRDAVPASPTIPATATEGALS